MRLILLGPPGSGKSTFLEWLQLQLASTEEELVLGEQQAIPVLLRAGAPVAVAETDAC